MKSLLKKPTDATDLPARPASSAAATTQLEPHWRLLSLLTIYEIVTALALLSFFFFVRGIDTDLANPKLFVGLNVLLILFGAANAAMIWLRKPTIHKQIMAQAFICTGLLLSILYASGGTQHEVALLLVIPISIIALIGSQSMSLANSMLAALGVLGVQLWSHYLGHADVSDYPSAGLTAAILLIIHFAIRPITKRFREAQALAEQRGVDLANLAELNEYIIQHLRESIVVIDGQDRVRLINTSAIQHICQQKNVIGKTLAELSPKLFTIIKAWRKNPQAMDDRSFVSFDGASVITPQIAPIGSEQPSAALIFLEDANRLTDRIQEIKLAALGRLSASIAHEIRNPVAAISHAGQLLAESEQLNNNQDRRLIEIVNNHTERVNIIIKNILQLSKRDNVHLRELSLKPWVEQFISEFADAQTSPKPHITLHGEAHITAYVDPSHLHQVFWNLCENAVRYGKNKQQQAKLDIHFGALTNSGRTFLEVRDHGLGVPPDIAEKIFEPFFSGRRTSTGLGLFIAKQLCECNRATLAYEPRKRGGSIFRVVFADPKRWTQTS